MSKVFMGEMMTCIMSGRKQRSNPNVESNWDCLVLDGSRYYVSAQWREKSYKKRGTKATWDLMLRKAIEIHNQGK